MTLETRIAEQAEGLTAGQAVIRLRRIQELLESKDEPLDRDETLVLDAVRDVLAQLSTAEG